MISVDIAVKEWSFGCEPPPSQPVIVIVNLWLAASINQPSTKSAPPNGAFLELIRTNVCILIIDLVASFIRSESIAASFEKRIKIIYIRTQNASSVFYVDIKEMKWRPGMVLVCFIPKPPTGCLSQVTKNEWIGRPMQATVRSKPITVHHAVVRYIRNMLMKSLLTTYMLQTVGHLNYGRIKYAMHKK